MDKLFNLLNLLIIQRQALESEDKNTLCHTIANKTLKVVPYKQAVYWDSDGLNVKLDHLSGNVNLDKKSPYALALVKFIKKHVFQTTNEAKYENIYAFTPKDLQSEGDDFGHPGVLMVFKTPQEGVMGGLWLEREVVFDDDELKILSELCVAYTSALTIANFRAQSIISVLTRNLRQLKFQLFLVLIIILFIPVKLSITAPVEIIAQNPVVISSPFEGTLDNILVQPGDTVEAGQLIAEMDKLNLNNKLESTQQELKVARAKLSRLKRESLASPEKKIEIKRVEADIAAKKIEHEFATDMFERSNIRSQKNGIAIFADKNALKGKPMRMGEKIMMIADPREQELLVRVPVDAMIPLSSEAEVKFYLNVEPLKGYSATIRSIGYQATPDTDGLLTYKIHAILDEKSADMRIGWKGTAKIYSKYVTMGYALLRRPLINLRELFGV